VDEGLPPPRESKTGAQKTEVCLSGRETDQAATN
jgi:hypothetical protein